MLLSKFKARVIAAIKEVEIGPNAVDGQLAHNEDTKIALGFT
jgi:hypothetical protein